MPKITVSIQHAGQTWYLKGTTWTGELDRAFKYESEEQAYEALEKAKKFMAPAIKKAAKDAILTNYVTPTEFEKSAGMKIGELTGLTHEDE